VSRFAVRCALAAAKFDAPANHSPANPNKALSASNQFCVSQATNSIPRLYHNLPL